MHSANDIRPPLRRRLHLVGPASAAILSLINPGTPEAANEFTSTWSTVAVHDGIVQLARNKRGSCAALYQHDRPETELPYYRAVHIKRPTIRCTNAYDHVRHIYVMALRTVTYTELIVNWKACRHLDSATFYHLVNNFGIV